MSKKGNNMRFYIYTIAFLPFSLLLASGIILLKYHTGAQAEETVMGQNAYFWFPFHKISAILSTLLIGLHLFVKTNWVQSLFRLRIKGGYKKANIFLFVVFLLCVFTGFGSDLVSARLGGVHNKLGLVLFILFLIHLWNYRKVIINHFSKLR